MDMFMVKGAIIKFVRKILGAIVLFIDAITRSAPMHRSAEDQARIDLKAKSMSLYQFHACPFCVKVRRALHALNVTLELRDAQKEPYQSELLNEGGKRVVPCLRIEEHGRVRWMYNSKDIVSFLQSQFK